MLIIVSNDSSTMQAIKQLQVYYPNETVSRMGSFLLDENVVRKEKDGKTLPTRFTFMSHGSQNTIDGKTPEVFAKKVIEQFTKAAKNYQDANIKKITIDLLGCGFGHVDENIHCAALTIARELRQLKKQFGIDVTVNAFTNLVVDKPLDLQSIYIRLSVSKENSFDFCTMKDEKSFDDYFSYTEQLMDLEDKIDECNANMFEFKAKLTASSAEYTTLVNQLREYEEKIQNHTKQIQACAKEIENIFKVNNMSQSDIMGARKNPKVIAQVDPVMKRQTELLEKIEQLESSKKTLSSSIAKLSKNQQTLNSSIVNLKKNSEIITQEMQQLREKRNQTLDVVVTTNDIRKTFDSDLAYNCTELVALHDQILAKKSDAATQKASLGNMGMFNRSQSDAATINPVASRNDRRRTPGPSGRSQS